MTNIKKLRLNCGATQQQLATILGITRGAYSNIENEKREPDIATLIQLADFFGVSVDYLINHKEKGEKKMNTIGHRIKETREKNGKTLEQFSDFIGISLDQLQRFEADQDVPPVDVVKKIATRYPDIMSWLYCEWENDVKEDYYKDAKTDDLQYSFFERHGVPFNKTEYYLALVKRLNPSIEEKEMAELRSRIENSFGIGTVELLRDYASMNATGKAEVRKYAHSLTFDPAYKKEEKALKHA